MRKLQRALQKNYFLNYVHTEWTFDFNILIWLWIDLNMQFSRTPSCCQLHNCEKTPSPFFRENFLTSNFHSIYSLRHMHGNCVLTSPTIKMFLWDSIIYFFGLLILHLELHFRASQFGRRPSLLSGSVPAIICTLCCSQWQGTIKGCCLFYFSWWCSEVWWWFDWWFN